MKLLCRLGLHKWEKAGGFSQYSSNVREQYYVCKRCGERKKEVVAKKGDDFF